MARSKPRANYHDLLNLPDHVVGEILDGELHASPRPRSRHARATTQIAGALLSPFDRESGGPDGLGGWWILIEPELHLHGDVVVPDIAGWRRERMAELLDVAAFEQPPDWVCEVLSPSTARLDRMKKMPIYERERVGHVWLVDASNRTLEAFTLDGERMGRATIHGEDERARIAPFAAVELELSRWWMA